MISLGGLVGQRLSSDPALATLPLPNLMLYALQVNIRGGALPPPQADGRVFFKVPANRFAPPREAS